MFQHQGHHWMGVLQFFQYGRIRAPAGLGFARFFAIQAELVKEQFTQLLGGGQVEIHASGGAGFQFQPRQGGGQLAGELRQVGRINADAGGLHQGEHGL